MAKKDALVGQKGISAQEAAENVMCADEGNSGTNGTGIDVSGTTKINCLTTFGFQPRLIRIDGAGNFGFDTLDDNPHVFEVTAKTEIRGYIIKAIYPASYATSALRTTATKIHVF